MFQKLKILNVSRGTSKGDNKLIIPFTYRYFILGQVVSKYSIMQRVKRCCYLWFYLKEFSNSQGANSNKIKLSLHVKFLVLNNLSYMEIEFNSDH